MVSDETVLHNLTFDIKLTPNQQQELDALLQQQQDPSSPEYHHWLTPEQYADQFGLASSDVQKISDWLQEQGFVVERVARARNQITFSGTVAQVSSAFRTEIHRYVRNGEEHYSNSSDPMLPKALMDIVGHIGGLNNFRPKPLIKRSQSADASLPSGVTPSDLASFYDFDSLQSAGYTGKGQTIVIVGQSAIEVSDIEGFQSAFGLPNNVPTVVPGDTTDPGTIPGDVVEADADLEWAGAVAPDASLVYVYAQDAFTAAQYAIDNKLGAVVNISFGSCESKDSSNLDSLRTMVQEGNSFGITVVAGSGDSGAAACEDAGASTIATTGLAVSVPASIPEVTAVGGTQFSGSGETTWNDTAGVGALDASGGGVSNHYPKPAWQTGPGVPASDTNRDVPDVAVNAAGYLVFTSGSFGNSVYGGTSIAGPVITGMVGLLNQYLTKNGFIGTPGLANINPMLYKLWQTNSDGATLFHDITTGDNKVPCQAGTPDCPNGGTLGYSAGPGYDQTTGIGSVDVANLVHSWGQVTGTPSVQVSPSTVTFGSSQAVGSTSAAQTVTLSNTGGAALNVTSIAASGDFAETNNCEGSVAAGGSCSIDVTFTPTATGTRTGTLTITDNASGSPQTVALSGTGSGPSLTLSPASLTFAPQVVSSTSAAQSVTLTNNGNAALTISSIAMAGANAAEFAETNTCGGSVAAGANCTISVTFKPTVSGSGAASLTITDNVLGSPQTVTLSGGGEDFSLGMGSAGSGSGAGSSATVAPGSTATYTLSIAPAGGLTGTVTFTCSGAPSGATCTANPASVNLNGSGSASTTISVSTTAPSLISPRLRLRPPAAPDGTTQPIMLGMLALLAVMAAFTFHRVPRARSGALEVLLASLLLLSGCGGGGGAGGGTGNNSNPGTPAGTYNLTVTATYTSGSTTVQHTTTLSLTVS